MFIIIIGIKISDKQKTNIVTVTAEYISVYVYIPVYCERQRIQIQI